jgi:hypothetical protein
MCRFLEAGNNEISAGMRAGVQKPAQYLPGAGPAKGGSFNQLVGASEKCGRHGEAQFLGRFEVDD